MLLVTAAASGADILLLVYDVRHGRFVLMRAVEDWPLGDPAPSPGFVGYAIDASGDVALIERDAGVDTLRLRTAAAAARSTRRPTIGDLALAGGSVTWSSDGQARAAPLSG